MFTLKDQPRSNGFSNSMLEDENLRKAYWDQTLDKFVKEYLLPDVETPNGQPDFSSQKEQNTDTDMVWNHAMQLLKYSFYLRI